MNRRIRPEQRAHQKKEQALLDLLRITRDSTHLVLTALLGVALFLGLDEIFPELLAKKSQGPDEGDADKGAQKDHFDRVHGGSKA